jgi:hypothetical protein
MPQKYVALYFYVHVNLQKFKNSFTNNFKSFFNLMIKLNCYIFFINYEYFIFIKIT